MSKILTRAQINAVIERVGDVIDAHIHEVVTERNRVNSQLRNFKCATNEEFADALQQKKIIPVLKDNEIMQCGMYLEFCLNDKALLNKLSELNARIIKLDVYKKEQLSDLRFNLTLTGNDEAKDIVSEMKKHLDDNF